MHAICGRRHLILEAQKKPESEIGIDDLSTPTKILEMCSSIEYRNGTFCKVLKDRYGNAHIGPNIGSGT